MSHYNASRRINENDEQPSSVGSQEVSAENKQPVHASSPIAENQQLENVAKPLLDDSLRSHITAQTAPRTRTDTIPATFPDTNYSNAKHWQPGRWDWWPAPSPSELLGTEEKKLGVISPNSTITSSKEGFVTRDVDYRKRFYVLDNIH
jgi:hypothetical protein